MTVTAKNSKGTELFVGTASGVDADSYLDGVAQEQISDVSFPNSASHRFTPGDAKPEADIADRDWWISKDTGQTVAKTFDLDAEPQVLVIAPANSDDSLDGTTVSLQMRVKGVFALSLLGIAGTIILAGFSVFFFMRWWSSRIRPPKKDVGRSGNRGSDGGGRNGRGGSDGGGSGPDERNPRRGGRSAADDRAVKSSRLIRSPSPRSRSMSRCFSGSGVAWASVPHTSRSNSQNGDVVSGSLRRAVLRPASLRARSN